MVSEVPEKRQGVDEYGRSEIHYAKDANVIQLMIDSGTDINRQDDNGWCPLHFYAQACNIDAVEVALANNADPNLLDSHGNGPLWTATMNAKGNFSCVVALLKSGANATRKNMHGRSPSDMANTIKGGLERVFADDGHA
ncbi:ankyrin repeat domain-containing protein [Saccharospirillum sp.]|uniref:ankyrin repeat domain-containing protein n=1 Tax=Saccharospirillum sp. TaxID=2033801 RepID=UPI00349FD358